MFLVRVLRMLRLLYMQFSRGGSKPTKAIENENYGLAAGIRDHNSELENGTVRCSLIRLFMLPTLIDRYLYSHNQAFKLLFFVIVEGGF